MGWSESERRCKKHPQNRRSPGVCSCCLQERLAQLSSSKPSLKPPPSSSSLSSTSSSSCSYSSASSPSASCMTLNKRGKGNRYQISSLISKEVNLFLQSEKPITRSKSLAVPVINRTRESGGTGNLKKKGKFWSMLFRSGGKRKKEAGLSHSLTVKEQLSSAWDVAHVK